MPSHCPGERPYPTDRSFTVGGRHVQRLNVRTCRISKTKAHLPPGVAYKQFFAPAVRKEYSFVITVIVFECLF